MLVYDKKNKNVNEEKEGGFQLSILSHLYRLPGCNFLCTSIPTICYARGNVCLGKMLRAPEQWLHPLPVTLWRSHAHVLTPRSALPARMYDEAMIELLLSHPICYSRSCTFCAPAFCSLCSTIHGVFGSLLLSLALNFSVIYVIQISPMSSGRLHESSRWFMY